MTQESKDLTGYYYAKIVKSLNYLKRDDPSFDGGFRDALNRSEKLGLITEAHERFEIRQLRNVSQSLVTFMTICSLKQKIRRN